MTSVVNPGSGDFTLSLWVEPDNVADSAGSLFGQSDGSGTGRTWLEIVSGALRSGLGGSAQSSGFTPSNDSWYNFVIVHDDSANTLTWYVNGKRYNVNTSVSVEAATGSYIIGDDKGGSGDFDGKLDDIRLFGFTLSQDQVKKLYTGGAALYFGPETGIPQ